MTSAPIYYINNNTPKNDPNWLGSVTNTISSTITEALVRPGIKIPIKFAVAALTGASVSHVSTVITQDVEYFEDTSQIKLGNELYPKDVVADAILSTALTSAVLFAAGVTATSVLGLAIVGGTGYIYIVNLLIQLLII